MVEQPEDPSLTKVSLRATENRDALTRNGSSGGRDNGFGKFGGAGGVIALAAGAFIRVNPNRSLFTCQRVTCRTVRRTRVKVIADFQFGREAGPGLFPDGCEVMLSGPGGQADLPVRKTSCHGQGKGRPFHLDRWSLTIALCPSPTCVPGGFGQGCGRGYQAGKKPHLQNMLLQQPAIRVG